MGVADVYISFEESRKLCEKGFYYHAFSLPPYTCCWYDHKGDTTGRLSLLPRVTYATVERWLRDIGIIPLVRQPYPDEDATGSVYVRVNDGRNYPAGEEPYRAIGPELHFHSFDAAYRHTVMRAVSAVYFVYN